MTSRPGWGPDALLKPFNEHLIVVADGRLQGARRPLRDGLGAAVLRRLDLPLPALRGAPLPLSRTAGRGLGGPPRSGAGPLPRRRLRGPLLGVPDGFLRVGRGRPRGADRARPRGRSRRSLGLRPAPRLDRLRRGRPRLPRRRAGRPGARAAAAPQPRLGGAGPAAAYRAGGWDGARPRAVRSAFETVQILPRYVFDAAAAGTASILGREAFVDNGHPPLLASLLVAVLVLVAAARIVRGREVSRGLAVALALAFSYWMLIGLNRTGEGRFALLSRYQFPSAVFILVVAAELLRGVRIPRSAAAVAAVVAAAALIGGISLLASHYEEPQDRSRDQADDQRARHRRPGAVPDRKVSFPPAVPIPAGRYLRAAAQDGSPGYTEEELLERPGARTRAAGHDVRRIHGDRAGPHERGGENCGVSATAVGGQRRRPRLAGRVHPRQHRSVDGATGPRSVCRRSSRSSSGR